MTQRDYSAAALVAFLDYLSDKGLLKQNTASSRKAAAVKILGILDESEKVDLRKIDVDGVFRRFSNLEGNAYKPDSLQVYASRFRTALAEFVAYVDNDKHYRTQTVQRSGRANGERVVSSGEQSSKPKSKPSNAETESHHSIPASALTVPVPLRADLTIQITNLPADLTAAEAEKLAAIVKAYAAS